jgi:ABC-type proline/glycine betaine transport system ATPase subunit
MHEGRIVQQGSIDDLRKRPANDFVREFINAQRSLVSL